jgi:hypothetical protein
MDSLFAMAEQNFPETFTGKRQLQFYKDWHEWLVNSDSDSDDSMDIDTSKHPKDFPRCN